jgi:hypothetical protein
METEPSGRQERYAVSYRARPKTETTETRHRRGRVKCQSNRGSNLPVTENTLFSFNSYFSSKLSTHPPQIETLWPREAENCVGRSSFSGAKVALYRMNYMHSWCEHDIVIIDMNPSQPKDSRGLSKTFIHRVTRLSVALILNRIPAYHGRRNLYLGQQRREDRSEGDFQRSAFVPPYHSSMGGLLFWLRLGKHRRNPDLTFVRKCIWPHRPESRGDG